MQSIFLRWNKEEAVSNFDLLVVLILLTSMHLRLETKFTQMFKGVAVVLIVKTLIELSNINMLKVIIEKVVSSDPVVGFVVFQPEIRNGLQRLGRIVHLKKRRPLDAMLLCSIEKAVAYMAERRIGALITIERNMDLAELIETGIRLNADITAELIMNIFTPNTPLHDGAVIIRGEKIVAASTYLPLTQTLLSNKYGTRHRAALGVSETNDSITIVVSEESGEISVTFQGMLLDNLTVEKCLQVVGKEMSWM